MENAKILKYEIYGKFFWKYIKTIGEGGWGAGNPEDFDYISTEY
jgi:hypothetical protein